MKLIINYVTQRTYDQVGVVYLLPKQDIDPTLGGLEQNEFLKQGAAVENVISSGCLSKEKQPQAVMSPMRATGLRK